MQWAQRVMRGGGGGQSGGDALPSTGGGGGSAPGGGTGGGGGGHRLVSLRGKVARAIDRPSLLNKNKPFFTGVHRFGVARFALFLQDPFHTLLNLSWWKFIAVFFATYVVMFCAFAFLYWATPAPCMHGVDGSFAHALWVSSRTASTLGFTDVYPNPDCVGPNLIVMLQVICSSLLDMCMLGVVFARFSAPFKRAQSIRFSRVAAVARHPSGYWAITFRVANVRKHQLLKPDMRLIVTAIDSITPSNYVFEHLAIEDLRSQNTNLQLGFPANVTHVVRPDSPLYNLSLEEMDTRMMEVLAFVDGIDAMTSKQLQARRAYSPAEMRLCEQFVAMHLEVRGGRLGLDFTHFDDTVAATGEMVAEYEVSPQLRGLPMPEVQHYMQHMRHYTFRRLTEQRAGSAAGGGGGANGAKRPPGAAAAPTPPPPVAASPSPVPPPAQSPLPAAAAAAVELTPTPGGAQSQSQQQQQQPLANPFAGQRLNM